MNLTVIIIVAVVFLLLIGATQRKRLLLILKSEVNAVTKEAANSIKVLDLRITELKEAINKTVEAAGNVFAQIRKTEADIQRMEAEVELYLSDAKKAKADGNESVAKAKLEAHLITKKTLEKARLDLIELEQRKVKLEVSITRMKLKKNTYSNEIEILRGRDAVNKAMKSVAGINGNGDLGDAIQEFDNKVSFDENKFGYMVNSSEEDFSAEVQSSFEKL